MRDQLKFRVVARLGQFLLDRLFGTARFEFEGAEHVRRLRDEGRPCIFVFWHGRLLPLAYAHRNEGVVTLISRSEDGEYIARVVERWGYLTARGSSSRGGSRALRELVRHARAGRSIAITPDGPRGPRQKFKPGAILAAQVTGLPLVPVAAGADRAWWFEGWDRFLVPKPFARIRVAYGAPVEVPADAGPGALEEYAQKLENELNRLLHEVDRGTRR